MICILLVLAVTRTNDPVAGLALVDVGLMEASRNDWLGGRQFDVDRYLHGATLEETVATGVHCLVTGKRRDSNVYFVQSGESWVLVDTAWRGRAELGVPVPRHREGHACRV